MSNIETFKKLVDEAEPTSLSLEVCVLRDLIAWKEATDQSINELSAKIAQLEGSVSADRQNLDEVDGSVRQTWESLDGRVKELAGRVEDLERDCAPTVVGG